MLKNLNEFLYILASEEVHKNLHQYQRVMAFHAPFIKPL